MHTVAVLSLKGGVGKTTVALGLASAALRRGARALVADLDPQGNATATLNPPMTEATLTAVLDTPREAVIDRALAPSGWSPELDVFVSSEDLELLNEPGPDARRMDNLARALDVLRTRPRGDRPYEIAILDCPPSLGRLTRSALLAADTALLVTEPTMYAVSGAERAFEAIEAVRRGPNPRLRSAGVLVNRLRPRSYEHHYRVEELRETFGRAVMPTAIPDRLAIQQAQGACMPIHEWRSPGAHEIALTFNMVLAKILRSSRAGRHRLPGEPDADSQAQPDSA
ncbi:ParA family protein [Prauserella rugosa]|uniref:Cellulose biosynthesis protein BcsQ n=1 Tax=Prauserella rugosa TaxID=43354 RepID=A0A660CB27_9PSEU|nr:ParA family protein [Prauserella rugosa]KMS87689.1 chromosome partitioning protein ParA [Streptomyces regensis]TWH18963.1 cellulose biosynthesis protein BcsQ [Prauserella rugosa]